MVHPRAGTSQILITSSSLRAGPSTPATHPAALFGHLMHVLHSNVSQVELLSPWSPESISTHSPCVCGVAPSFGGSSPCLGTGEQAAAPALQRRQNQSWRGRAAAHGGVVEDLRLGSGHPQHTAGPGRGPGRCGRGTAGEGAASAASGLLGVSALTPASCLPASQPSPVSTCLLWHLASDREEAADPRRSSSSETGPVPANALLSLMSSLPPTAWT